MKKQLIRIVLFFTVILTVVTMFYSRKIKDYSYEDTYQEQLVSLNEIVKLSEKQDEESKQKMEQAVTEFQDELRASKTQKSDQEKNEAIWVIYGGCIIFLLSVFAYTYYAVLRPFDKLQKYADELANGNFDVELNYERTNYFGKFTWAFDHMRKEITKARACEKEAINNNKTVIATLSHDIKTPISSIRAYAEALDAGLDSGPEKRRLYSSVIMNKCDEVTKLTNDLFLHSLSDLDKLRMNPSKVNLQELLEEIIAQMQVNNNVIIQKGKIPGVTVSIDAKRFEQVIENLINNAKKYAEGNIEISSEAEAENVFIHIRDHGRGIPDEDMPFIFDKFYRGRNAGNEQGSGLGLYIVKYIMEQTGGKVELSNSSKGLTVILIIPICS